MFPFFTAKLLWTSVDFNVHVDSQQRGRGVQHFPPILVFGALSLSISGNEWASKETLETLPWAVSLSLGRYWIKADQSLIPTSPYFKLDADQYFSVNSPSPDRLEHNWCSYHFFSQSWWHTPLTSIRLECFPSQQDVHRVFLRVS